MTGQVYAVASGKGGVGKTTTAINLGAMLAEMDHGVVVVDTDLGMANVAGFLDFEMDGPTLHEVLAGDADVADATYDAPGDIAVLPSSVDIHAFADSETSNLQQVVAQLRESYDVVLLDTGAGISYDTMLPLSLADSVLLVTTPDVASVRDTAKTGELTDHVDGTVRGAVLTQRSSDILNAEDVEGTLDTDVIAVVPADETVPMGIDAGRPLAAFAPNSPAATAYRDLAKVLLGVAEKPSASELASERSGSDVPNADEQEAGKRDSDASAAATPEDALNAATSDAESRGVDTSDGDAPEAGASADSPESAPFTPDSESEDSAPSLADAESEIGGETPGAETDPVRDLIDERIVESGEERAESSEYRAESNAADAGDATTADATGAADAADESGVANATDATGVADEDASAATPRGDVIEADDLPADHFATSDGSVGDTDGADFEESSSEAPAPGDAGRDGADRDAIEGIEEAEPDDAGDADDTADEAVPFEEGAPEQTEFGAVAEGDDDGDDSDDGIFGRIGSLFK